MTITVLSDETVKLIKSTQVVSNVWSVVKELVENSLDANANNVEVYLIENGLSLIKVSDNGCGISKEDAPYMGLPSYTSKMTTFKDLESLISYGFRGVALNSMCALANVSVTTKTDADQVATIYNLNQNGEIVQTGEVHGNRGTTIQVKDLCKSFPVRKKILSEPRYVKKDLKNIEMLIKDFSICNPGVRFVLQINGKVIFSKPIVKDLKEALTHVVGRANVLNLHRINHSVTEVEVDLLVPKKYATNLSDNFKSGQSYIFINKRPVKQKDIEQIILKKIIEYFSSEHPNVRKCLFVLNINVDPAKVDVNLEPNKDKVFLHDKEKFEIILDEILSDYYGLQVMERSDSNKENTVIENPMSDETFDPDSSSINDSVETRKETKKRCYAKESRKFEHVICPPVLSEPDSDEDGGMPRKKRRSPCVETILEKPQLSVNEKKDQDETLSQLPVVNLGEDFDLLDLYKNISTSVNVAEKVEKKDENTSTKTDVAVEIGSDAWSRGQIIGGGGVNVLPVNYVDLESNNTTVQTKHPSTLNSGFGIFFSEARSQIMRENPDSKEAEVANQISTRWHKELSSEERGYYRDQALQKQEVLTPRSQKRSLADADMNESGKKMMKIIKYLKNEKQENKEKQSVRLKKTILPWNITLQDIKTNFKKTLTSTKKQDLSTSITIIGHAPENDNFWFVKYDNSNWMINVHALLKESDEHKNTLPCQVNATMLKQVLDKKLANNSEIDITVMHHIHDF